MTYVFKIPTSVTKATTDFDAGFMIYRSHFISIILQSLDISKQDLQSPELYSTSTQNYKRTQYVQLQFRMRS